MSSTLRQPQRTVQHPRSADPAWPERTRSGIVADSLVMASCREAFLRTLEGRKPSPLTVCAYGSDLAHLASWLEASYPAGIALDEVQASDIDEYLAALARRGLSGVTMARRLAAIREFFRFLVVRRNLVAQSPAWDIRAPRREARLRVWLRPDEYTRMVSETAGHPSNCCIFQVFMSGACWLAPAQSSQLSSCKSSPITP